MQWYAVEVDKMTRIDGNSEDDFSLSEVEEEEEEEERNNGRAMDLHRFRSARSLHVEVLLFPIYICLDNSADFVLKMASVFTISSIDALNFNILYHNPQTTISGLPIIKLHQIH